MIMIRSLLHVGEMIQCLGFAIKYSNPHPPQKRKTVEWENQDIETFLSYMGKYLLYNYLFTYVNV